MIRPMIVFWLPYYSIFQTKPHRGGLKWFEHVGQAVQPQVPFRVVSNKLQIHWLKMELSHWYGKKEPLEFDTFRADATRKSVSTCFTIE